MGVFLAGLAGGLQGASKGLESMEESRARRRAEARQTILDAINQQNIEADNRRADAQLDMNRELGGYTKDASGNWSFDVTNTREARVAKLRDEQEARKISAAEVAYIAAGMDPKKAALAARNPSLADNILFPVPHGPAFGTPEYEAALERSLAIRDRHEVGGNGRPPSFAGVKSGASSSAPGAARSNQKGVPAVSEIDAALDRFGGDVQKATEFLRQRGHK